MKLKMKLTGLICALLLFCSLCVQADQPEFVKKSFQEAEQQTKLMVDRLLPTLKIPNSVDKKGELTFVDFKGWTAGFFPGTLWFLYENNQKQDWLGYAQKWTAELEQLRHFTDHHDVGFMVGCSYGTGYRLTKNPEYKDIIIDAANALCTRFNPKVGLIKSWDRPDPAQYLVIIDNMMNLELLFMAYNLTGNRKFYDVAISHADKTIENHFRPDGSSFHVVDYDANTGEVRRRHTSQGYSDSSAWARGQAWGLYGYSMCYRETKDKRYLRQAETIADFILNHPNLPQDYIFYWDFDSPEIPNAPRDVSAAAVAASALLELSKLSPQNKQRYYDAAEKILKSLSGKPYFAPIGENQNFILTSSVGSYPHKSQVTVPLCYADYYFLEALSRYVSY